MSDRDTRPVDAKAVVEAARKQARYAESRRAWARDYWNGVATRAAEGAAHRAARSVEADTSAERRARTAGP